MTAWQLHMHSTNSCYLCATTNSTTHTTWCTCQLLTFVVSQLLVAALYSKMEMVPSDEAAAKTSPSSWGAHAMLLTEAVCRVAGLRYTCKRKEVIQLLTQLLMHAARHALRELL